MTTADAHSAWSLIDRQAHEAVELSWSSTGGPRIVAIDSEKGGVGKTALTAGLAAVAGAAGLRTLAIDLDPRATLTEELDALSTGSYTVNDLLYVDPDSEPVPLRGLAADAIRPSGPAWPDSVMVLAAERSLGWRETDTSTPNLEHRLRVSLDGVAERFDLVVLDLPPRAGGRLVGSGLLAATHVLLPATLDEDGYIGARDALRTIGITAETDPSPAVVAGLVRNVVDRETQLARMYDDKLRAEYPDLLLDVAVPKRVIRQEARTACVPITTATSPQTRSLIAAYTLVLNAIGGR